MQFANDKDGNRVHIDNAERGVEYFCPCPVCKSPLLLKKGAIRAHHFSHKNNTCSDSWHYEEKSPWHINWQNRYTKNCQEVYKKLNSETHRADILIEENKTVIEFQHSRISQTEFDARNRFYTTFGYRVIWLFDFVEEYEKKPRRQSVLIPESRNVFDKINFNDDLVEVYFQIEYPAFENPVIQYCSKILKTSENADELDLICPSYADYYYNHQNDLGVIVKIKKSHYRANEFYYKEHDEYDLSRFVKKTLELPDYSIKDTIGSIFELWTWRKCADYAIFENTAYTNANYRFVRIKDDPNWQYKKYGRIYGDFSATKKCVGRTNNCVILNADKKQWKMIYVKTPYQM